MSNSARIASNVLGTPWPVLWGTRELSGTLIAWTNHTYTNSGSSGKGGGQVAAGEKDYRTFALGLCLGPIDRINAIWYDNTLIWSGNVTIASAATSASATQGVGSVVLTDNANRGTITVYFGLETQTQDPILAQFIPDAPFYRGMCYAVFHGARNGKKGFRIGNADTLAQVAVNVTRVPPAVNPSSFSAIMTAPNQPIGISAHIGSPDSLYSHLFTLTATRGVDDGHLNVTITDQPSGLTPIQRGIVNAANGVAFSLGVSGMQATLSWPSSSSPPLGASTSATFTVSAPLDSTSVVAASQALIGVTPDLSGWTGLKDVMYLLVLTPGSSNATLNVAIGIVTGIDTGGATVAANGMPFAVGTSGLMVTLSWTPGTSPIAPGGSVQYQLLIEADSAANNGGANIGSMLYELLTSTISGFALNPALLDAPSFNAFANNSAWAGLNYMTTEKADARSLVQDILKNVQGAITCSNGLIAPRLMGFLPNGSVAPTLTLEADDVVGYKIRPGAWYEIPQHVTVRYRDSGRFYRDTVASLPGAGSASNDEKQIELDLPMVTDLATARLIGLRMKALEALPKKPDTLTCGRAAFPVQFGDIIALNNPQIGTLPGAFGHQPGNPLVVLAVREQGPGSELIELDVAPDVFGYLPVDILPTGSGGSGQPAGPGTPYLVILYQDAFEFPTEWATDGSKKFCMFAARADPDAQGFTLWASSENPPVDYNEVDTDALYCAGGRIVSFTAPRFTMDREASIVFTAGSQDIDTWQSVSDNGWFGMEFLVLLGGDDSALLFAAQNLQYLGNGRFQITGLWGPLSDTIGGSAGDNIWAFAWQPPYSVGALPNWINGASIHFKGIPFGSRLSPTLNAATTAQHTISSRALRPRMVQNVRANCVPSSFGPSYLSGSDIALSWDLCNRLSGFGAETNPSPFDPTIASEVRQCQIDVVVGRTVVNTYTANTRAGSVTSVSSVVNSAVFSVASASGLQVGDAISIFHHGGTGIGDGEWFGRIASIVGNQVTLISPLAITPSAGDTLNRYEAAGFVYTAAMNAADNGATPPSSITFNIYAYLNGLRSLRAAAITVTKQP
ncbi:MAG TPA: phage tail protein [Verrucomicrobiae bacterium]|nr:phage tail protein [Verrucomicrobiae bacterium]